MAVALGASASVAAAADDPVTFRGSFAWINAWEHQVVDESSVLNPDNRGAVPKDQGVSELRPNLKLATSTVQLVVRPRVRYTYEQATVAGKAKDGHGTTDDKINEAFLQWTLNESVTLVYGRQNYQWGGVEVMSPSNRLFHETAQNRTVLYEVPGKEIARLNFSAGKQLSLVAMAEVKENKDEAAFQADVPFQPQGLVKGEYGWHDGSDYVGLVLGGREHGPPWAGAYFNYGLPFFDGLSVFADGSAQHGSEAWYPDGKPVVSLAQTKVADDKTYSLVAGGLKYDFINGSILRGEYLLNQAGYTTPERDQVLAAAASKNPLQLQTAADNQRRFGATGLELPGQRYAYASLHVPDLFTITDLVLEMRALHALGDGTSYGYGSLDYRIGDSGTATLAAAGTGGKRDGELKGLTSPQYTVAYRHDW